MIARCPHCRKPIDLEAVFTDENIRAILHLLPTFGDHGRLILEYVDLFSASPITRKAGTLRRILSELSLLWRDQRFSFKGRSYAISHTGIAEALRAVVSRQFDSPLRNHNYLKAVMIPIAEREFQQRSKEEERKLKQHEEALRGTSTRPREENLRPLAPEIKQQINAIMKK